MPSLATVEDVQNISKRSALNAGRKILGITITPARYEFVPDQSDPNAVREWVVDVKILGGISQQIEDFVLGAGNGLAIVRNVLMGFGPSGNLFGNKDVPVELRKTFTGQLQVVARAKVALPQLTLQEFSMIDLNVFHIAELELRDGVYYDAFGCPAIQGPGGDHQIFGGILFSCNVQDNTRLSRADELNQDDDGNIILLGINPAQRVIGNVTKDCFLDIREAVQVRETNV